MRILISDTGTYPLKVRKDDYCIYDRGNLHMCTGCKGCWTRTPGCCGIRDSLQHMGAMLELSEELVIVSRCWYGSVSPFVALVLERTMPYLCGLVNPITGEHKIRSKHDFKITVYFYGEDMSDQQKKHASEFIENYAKTMQATVKNIAFYKDILEMGETYE